MTKKFRNAFLTGLLIFLPLGTTIFVVNFLLNMFKEPATRFAGQLGLQGESFFFGLETLLALVGLFVGILALTFLGFVSNYVLGKFFINSYERILSRVPFVSTVYRTVKQIVDTFGKQNRAVFKQVVMIEYPRRDCYAIGFLTNDAEGETEQVTGRKLTNVFIPTTPNPTSGFLLLLPREDVIKMDMSVGEGMKLIISGGAVIPKQDAEKIKGKEKPTSGDSSDANADKDVRREATTSQKSSRETDSDAA